MLVAALGDIDETSSIVVVDSLTGVVESGEEVLVRKCADGKMEVCAKLLGVIDG